MKRLFGTRKSDRPSEDSNGELSLQRKEKQNELDGSLNSTESERTLTSMIGYLNATNAEDWSLALEVCDRASLDETNAMEAAAALMHEFKYGQPHAQLAAAKLLTIMLRHATDIFVSQCGQRKFLDTLEDLISSGQAAPVVKDRLLETIAAAAYTSARQKKGSKKDGFQGLWLRVKPAHKPDEGIPFDPEDVMFGPPSAGASYINDPTVPAVILEEARPSPAGNVAARRKPARTANGIIPHDEDIRRLFQRCQTAGGYASVVSEAVLTCTPSSLESNPIIKEFYTKCKNQQKLIFGQIEWATAQADQSRVKRNAERDQRYEDGDDETNEEKLLGALLETNEELLSALRQHDDLYQIEKQSRKELTMNRRETTQHQPQQQTEDLGVTEVRRFRVADMTGKVQEVEGVIDEVGADLARHPPIPLTHGCGNHAASSDYATAEFHDAEYDQL
ncbi:hypothetical protein BKA70DRAFT_1436083 [Coprinopsis sp. MPI-PUGE-AT-0042]|nr:hypothetical protein BKA70DRAFT_1436083 [Coprinopsis sp. MPI-PUGE-AT-0042]